MAGLAGAQVAAPTVGNTPTYSAAFPNYVVNTTSDDDGSYACTPLASTTSNTTDGNNGGNPGLCTLRDAINAASNGGGGNIYFDTTVFAASNLVSNAWANTIAIDNAAFGGLSLQSNTVIQGLTAGTGASAANLVTIDGGGTSNPTNGTIIIVGGQDNTIDNLNINHGYASNGGNGGAITNFGEVTIANSAFSGNQASASGGAIFNVGGTVTVVGSTFYRNSVTGGNGGAIDNSNLSSCGTIQVANSTFYQNSAANGGGGMGGALNNDDGGCLLFVSGSTIVANSTDRGSISGGGIQNASSLVLSNSILSGNTDGSSGADDLSDFGIGGNFFDGTNVVAGNLVGVYDGNPANGESVGLSPLGHYGGPTETMLPEPGSAAICGGLKSGIPAGTTKDQRGFAITNTTYSGYSSTAPCVDSGAVQTHYALRFNIQPSPISPDLSIQPGTNFRAGAKVTESSLSVTMPVTVALTLNGPGNLSGGAATTVSGEASYSALQIDTAGTGDALTATLTLNGSIALTASSSSFDVAASGPPFGWMLPVKDVTTGGTSGVAQADQLVVSGTAADPQDGTPVRQVQILIDGSAVDNATLGLASTGLQASYNNSAYARGGWSFTEPASALSAGTHTVSAVASDSLGQSTTIGTETFVVSTASSGPPVGWMFPVKDATTGGTGAVGQADNLSVSGTAGDPHDGTPVVQVQILIDGFAAGTATLNLASTGLEAAYNNPAYAHGGWNFAQPASGLSLGTHTLRAVASDSLGLSTVLGTETFTVAAVSSGPPVGWMFPVEDATTNSTSTVNVLNDLRVKGVAGDPHDGAPVEQVQILIDGAAVGTATLGLASPGLEATYSNPAYGEGGWTFTSAASNLSLGTHTIAAIATDSLNLSTTLGTGTFTVVASSGSLGSYQIDAWGDSLTQGNEDGTQITYPKKLAALTGQTVHAYGVGAQTSSQIAVRMNAYAGKPEQTFAAGFTIPTSGTVNVVFQTGFEPVNTEYLPAYGKSGVPVSFVVAGQSYSGSVIEASGAWIFTPDTYPTTAVSVPAGTAWLTVLSSGTNNGCVVIWAGRNNYTNGAQVQADIAAMVATVRQSTNCYLVMSIPNGEYSNEWKGRPAYNTIIALNSALSATYSPGNHYLDIRADLINMYNPAIPADVLDHMIDVWPYSLRAKDVSGSLTAALDSPTSCAISASVALGNGTILSENGELIKITGGSNGSYTCVRGYAGTTPETDPDGDLFTGVDALHLGQNADSPLNPNFTNGYSAVAAEVYAWLQANGSV